MGLTSRRRNPEQTTAWKADLEAAGAHIAFVSADATKISDIHRLRSDALQKHPPIAGIINGAMVLADGIFADLDIQDFRKVLRPKIDGSKNLDEVFAEDDLDFFVMFSSLTGVVGNRGQSHYAAANMVSPHSTISVYPLVFQTMDALVLILRTMTNVNPTLVHGRFGGESP